MAVFEVTAPNGKKYTKSEAPGGYYRRKAFSSYVMGIGTLEDMLSQAESESRARTSLHRT